VSEPAPPAGEVVELLQQLIRNECVNLNTPESGHEQRSVDTLVEFFGNAPLAIQTFEPMPGRGSIVARLPGTDPDAPSLALLGHLDVVPATASEWQHDPFGGELIDGWVWGRGAVDMLNMVATMAAAVRDLANSGFRSKGDLIFLGVADEESGGSLGAGWLTEHVPDLAVADNVVSEWYGVPIDNKLWITVGQKGGTDVRITVRGKAGHASMPFGSDNALNKAATIVQRIADRQQAPEITEMWRMHVERMEFDPDLTAALLDPSRIDHAIDMLPTGMAKRAHGNTRTTFSPTVIHGGVKSNVIPDAVELSVLIRRLPHQTHDDVMAMLDHIIDDLRDDVDITVRMDVVPTQSATDTPLWRSIERVSSQLRPGAMCVPAITPGGNDLGYFRDKGSTAYGFGLMSDKMSHDEFVDLWHSKDERVDVESLDLSTRFWTALAHDLLT
jgi:acetylornithine deacetylase/succinyl-diaminopimelate desuccinylase-like protein